MALSTWKLLLILLSVSSGGTGHSRFFAPRLSSPAAHTGCLGPQFPVETLRETCAGTHGDTEMKVIVDEPPAITALLWKKLHSRRTGGHELVAEAW